MQKRVNIVDLIKSFQRVFTCKLWRRYSRERASLSLEKMNKLLKPFLTHDADAQANIWSTQQKQISSSCERFTVLVRFPFHFPLSSSSRRNSGRSAGGSLLVTSCTSAGSSRRRTISSGKAGKRSDLHGSKSNLQHNRQ